MKKIALVGSTGSIGRQVIDVVRRNADKFKLVALVARGSAKLFSEQLQNVKPEFAALTDGGAAQSLGEIPAETTLFTEIGRAHV